MEQTKNCQWKVCPKRSFRCQWVSFENSRRKRGGPDGLVPSAANKSDSKPGFDWLVSVKGWFAQTWKRCWELLQFLLVVIQPRTKWGLILWRHFPPDVVYMFAERVGQIPEMGERSVGDWERYRMKFMINGWIHGFEIPWWMALSKKRT